MTQQVAGMCCVTVYSGFENFLGPILFDFVGLWAISFLVLGYPSTVEYGFLFMEWSYVNQTLVGSSHNLCATTALACFTGRINCG